MGHVLFHVQMSQCKILYTVHNVEMKPGKGGQLARSAGTYVQIVARDGAYVTLYNYEVAGTTIKWYSDVSPYTGQRYWSKKASRRGFSRIRRSFFF